MSYPERPYQVSAIATYAGGIERELVEYGDPCTEQREVAPGRKSAMMCSNTPTYLQGGTPRCKDHLSKLCVCTASTVTPRAPSTSIPPQCAGCANHALKHLRRKEIIMAIALAVFCFVVYLVMQSLNPHFGKGCGMLIICIALAIPIMLIGSLILSVALPFIFSTLPFIAFMVAICWVVKRLTRKTCP